MKVAVTSQGAELASQVDPRFGRAPYFVIAETDGDSFNALGNEQNVNASQGAGIQSAQAIADQGVEALLTGHCGPNAFRALKTAGIRIYVGASGTVSEALEKFKAGALEEAAQADVEGRWT